MPWALEFLGWARIPAVIVLFPNQARGKSTITAGITQYMAAGTQFGVGMKLAGGEDIELLTTRWCHQKPNSAFAISGLLNLLLLIPVC